jgi:hypothetical protein
MTVNAEKILFFAVPHPGSFTVETCLPLAEYGAVALPAEVVGFLEFYQLSIGESERIPVIRIVAVKTPSAGHVMQDDILVHHLQFSRGPVDRHTLVAL